MSKAPACSNKEQTIKINEILGADESYYTLTDVFNLLPESIEISGMRGDLFISHTEISYSSLQGDWKLKLVLSFPTPINGNVFDSFIKALEHFKTHPIA